MFEQGISAGNWNFLHFGLQEAILKTDPDDTSPPPHHIIDFL